MGNTFTCVSALAFSLPEIGWLPIPVKSFSFSCYCERRRVIKGVTVFLVNTYSTDNDKLRLTKIKTRCYNNIQYSHYLPCLWILRVLHSASTVLAPAAYAQASLITLNSPMASIFTPVPLTTKLDLDPDTVKKE